MEQNSSPTAKFQILAQTETNIDAVVRHSERGKLDFPAKATVELGFSERYGYQVILCAFGSEGKWPVLVPTDYGIDRPRVEIAVPSAYSAKFLLDLSRNAREAYRMVRAWEKQRGLG